MLHVCLGCSTRYAPGLGACPHCGSGDFRPDYEEDDMPKATLAGPTNGPGAADGDDADAVAADVTMRSPKADLVDAAVNVAGVDPDEAQAMTKADLVETIQQAAPPPAE